MPERQNPIDVIRRRYDEFAPTYVATWSKLEGYSGAVAKFLERSVREGAKVLDVGCGPGHLTCHLPGSVRVTGLDVSPGMIACARAARPGAEYLVHDYYEPFPVEPSSFDVVVAVGALDFCEDVPLVLGHIAAVARSGASVLVSLLERSPTRRGHRERRLAITPERMPGVDLVLYTLREMTASFEAVGLEPVRYARHKGYHNQYHALDVTYAMWELVATR